MTGSTSDHEIDDIRKRLAAAATYSTPSIDLESIVVRYEGRPDRCTITPRECSDADQLTTWLSADAAVFVNLDHYQ